MLGRHPPTLAMLCCPTVSHGMCTLSMESWRKSEAYGPLRNSVDAVICCEVEWQWWLQRQEERCRSDTSRADFFDSRWWESY